MEIVPNKSLNLSLSLSLSLEAVRGGGVKRGDVCYGMLRAAVCGRVGPPRTNVRVAWAYCERGQSR